MESTNSSFFEGFLGGILYGLNISDFAVPIGLLFWLICMSLKLSGIDFTEPLTGLAYCLYGGFVGLILVIVVPQKYHNFTDFKSYLAFFVLFFIVSGLKWANLMIKQKTDSILSQGQEGETDGKKT